MEENINIPLVSKKIGTVLEVIGSPARIAILIAIGNSEACVCHLESILGWRQAYISQHLMTLRKAGILEDRRDGRYIYYRLANTAILALVRTTATVSGIDGAVIDKIINPTPSPDCECPHCIPELLK